MRETVHGCGTRGRWLRTVTLAISLLVLVATLGPSSAIASHRAAELVSVGPNGANVAAYSTFGGTSQDGRYVWFTTADALVPEDTDGLCPRGYDPYYGNKIPDTPCEDVYQRDRVAGTTTLVSTGPNGNKPYDAKFAGASPDGSHVFIETGEPLVSEDTDFGCYPEAPYEGPQGCPDLYERVGDQTKLVSTGPTDPQGYNEIRYQSQSLVSADGSRVYFSTSEPLVAADTDSGFVEDRMDGYMRSGETTTLITQGPGDQHKFGAGVSRLSEDPNLAFFVSRENLTPDDSDNCGGTFHLPCLDVYARHLDTNTTELVSTGPRPSQGSYTASYGSEPSAVSRDGRYVFFRSAEAVTDDDVEGDSSTCSHDGHFDRGCNDIFRRDLQTSTTTLISTGPKKTGTGGTGTVDDAEFEYATPDGQRAFFSTEEQLVAADVDGQSDVYEWSNGTTTLISPSSVAPDQGKEVAFRGSSRDGNRVFLYTAERLLASDLDDAGDIYRASGGTIEQVSKGPSGGDAEIYVDRFGEEGVPSLDGSTTFFATAESLVPDDTDTAIDEYEWRDGETSLILDGLPTPSFIKIYGQTPDARHVFLWTADALTREDGDNNFDLYAATLNQPPSCDDVVPSTTSLLPANSHFRGVRLSGATDPEGNPVTLEITGVTQDEPVGRQQDARASFSPDRVLLRAERNYRGDGRVYRIAFTASDGTGECSGAVKVEVRRKRNRPAVDSAPPSFNSFGS
jgi:hypothetical protein